LRHGQAYYAGSCASATTGGFVAYESRLELARLLLADFDPQAERICAQPLRLAGRRRRGGALNVRVQGPGCIVGPMVRPESGHRINDLIDDAVSKGAKVVLGGRADDAAMVASARIRNLP
jgi:hypothetical protein